jgi:hypothetical protein
MAEMNPGNNIKANMFAKDLPWNCWDAEDLGPCVVQFMADQDIFYKRWAQKWFENYQFLFGNGDVRWSKRYDYAVDADFLLTKSPSTITKSYTNIARIVVEALTSFIYGNSPEWDCEASDDSKAQSKRVARIVESLLDGYFEQLKVYDDLQMAAFIYALYGQVAMCTYWSPIAGQTMEIPQFEKKQVPIFSDWMAANPLGGMIEMPTPALNVMSQPRMEERWIPLLDQMGRQIIKKMFTGDITKKVRTPLEYRREIGSQGMHKTKFYQEIDLLDYDEWLDQYGSLSGKTKLFNDVRPIFAVNTVYDFAVSQFMRMQLVTPPILNERMNKSNSIFRTSMFRHKVLVVNHYDKPHPVKWPMGRRLVIANGVCTHITVPQYNTNKIDGWHPAAEAQWMRVAPSSIGLGPVNDVIVKNRELNVKDSLNATAVRRNMGSGLLYKNNIGIDPSVFSGEPGWALGVNDVNAVRYLHDEQPISPIMEKLRQNDKDDAYESSGAGDALRGEKPTGVTSGYQEKIRIEREEKRLTPAKDQFYSMVSTDAEKTFFCLKANVVRLGDNMIGFLKRKSAGNFSIPDVVAVLTAPTDFGVDIKVKRSSMSIKSEATEQATIQELAQNPAVQQRLSQDARVLDQYLKKFGVDDLRDASHTQRDRAEKENEVFDDLMRLGANQEGISWPVVLLEDDDIIHEQLHTDFILQNADELISNPDAYKQILLHLNTHRTQGEEKLGKLLPGTSQQTAAAMGMAQNTPLPAPGQIMQYNQMQMQASMGQDSEMGKQPKEAGQPGAKPKDPAAPSDMAPPTTSGGL